MPKKFTTPSFLLKSGLVAALGYSGTTYYRLGFYRPFTSLDDKYNKERTFLPVRYEQEFEPLLLLNTVLLANFTVRNDPIANKLTAALHSTVIKHAEEYQNSENRIAVSVVDVEADEPGVRDLVIRYQIHRIPTIVAFKSGLPYATYTLNNSSVVDERDLKDWIDTIDD